jgi:PAS domain S-box-containing protein
MTPLSTQAHPGFGTRELADQPLHAHLFTSSDALLRAIVDSSDDAIISKDLNGIITSWNKGAERLFGYAAHEAIGKSVTLLIPADRLEEEPHILERLKRGERVDHFETVRQRKDGSTLDISLTISPVRDAHGQIVGASKIARDITERRRIESELQQHRHHLEKLVDRRTAELAAMHERLRRSERLSSLGTLSAGLGHDIGNVMMPLNVHIDAMQGKLGPAADEVREHFDAVRKSIEYLQNLAKGLSLLAIDPDVQGDAGGAVDVSKWWQQTEPLLKSALPRRCTLEHTMCPPTCRRRRFIITC